MGEDVGVRRRGGEQKGSKGGGGEVRGRLAAPPSHCALAQTINCSCTSPDAQLKCNPANYTLFHGTQCQRHMAAGQDTCIWVE